MNRLTILLIALSFSSGCSSFQASTSSPPSGSPEVGWTCTQKDPALALQCVPTPKVAQEPHQRAPSATDRVQNQPSHPLKIRK